MSKGWIFHSFPALPIERPPPPPKSSNFQSPSVFLCLLPFFIICTTALNVQVSCCDDQGRLV